MLLGTIIKTTANGNIVEGDDGQSYYQANGWPFAIGSRVAFYPHVRGK
jgi:hypothetical protein